MQITGSTHDQVVLYQADLRGVELAETRQSMDTYWLKQGFEESKIAKNIYVEYTATSTLTASVYYDQFTGPQYTFTLPPSQRISTRVRLPAIKYRLMRIIITSTADFQIWGGSKVEVKPVCSTKGYQTMDLVA